MQNATAIFVMCVGLSALPHGTTRLPVDRFSWNLMCEYLSIPPPPIFRKSVGKNQVSFKFDKNNWYFTWRHSHLWYCLAEFYLEWEMFQTEVLDKIKNTFLCSITVFRESCRLWNNVGKLGRAGKATDKAHALLAGCVRLHTHTRICNTCYFSMAATVPRTCFSVIRTLPGLL